MTKRGAGEGGVYKRSRDGKWVATLELGYQAGKRRRKEFVGKTRREVVDARKRAERDLQQGLPVTTEKQTVEQFLLAWLRDVVRQRSRPKTYVSHESIVRVHLIPDLGHHQLKKLTPQHVQATLNKKLEAGLAARTVVHIRATLRAALAQAERWELVARNVAALADPPHVATQEVAALSPTEARRLLDAVRGDRLEALFSVALSVGLRQGEALGLTWDDIDFEDGVLTVRHALQRIDGEYRLVEPKGQSSRRSIAMPRHTSDALRAHRTRQREQRLRMGPDWEDSGFVFTTSRGRPLYGPDVTRRMQSILKEAGLRRIRFHDLRHSCASLLLAQGVSMKVIQETLGHSSMATTANIYAHVMPELRQDAAQRMDDVLHG